MTTTTINGAADGDEHRQQPKIKALDPQLIAALLEYKNANQLTDAALGAELGVSGTMVNRALHGKFQGDAAAFEARGADLLKAGPERRRVRHAYFNTGFTRALREFFETIRRTGDIGLAYSPAGKGKTVGSRLYHADAPSASLIELSQWQRGADGLARALLAAVDARGWRRQVSRGEFLVERFRGSGRLIIVDNAQRLTASARAWLFDFHDATGCPIALVGNPEALDPIRANDQLLSRVGLRREIKGGSPREDAASLIRHHWPEAAADEALLALAVTVVKQRGHLRALDKQLLLARDIHGAGGEMFTTPADAFRAAHTQLIREYSLADENSKFQAPDSK